jgi:uncharacterized protein
MLDGQPCGVTMIANHCVPYVLRESSTLNILQSRVHGLDHWWRVWKNAEFLSANSNNVDLEIVALYALFHDSMRQNDGPDRSHGDRGYKLWERLCLMHGIDEYLTESQNEILFEACLEHSTGHRSLEPTIAVCWDADRLDLHRKGIWPDPRLMSTEAGIELTMNRLRSPNGRKTKEGRI